ncbi:unnamed protein product, partial [Dibothriocephalus latus]
MLDMTVNLLLIFIMDVELVRIGTRPKTLEHWFKTLLSEGQGCAIVVHSFFQMPCPNDNFDDSNFHAFLKSGETVRTDTFALPAFTTVLVCLLAVGDVFGEFRDQLRILLQPAPDLCAQIQQSLHPSLVDVEGMTYSRLCAWETTVHLGPTSVLADEVVRKVRMRNTSAFKTGFCGSHFVLSYKKKQSTQVKPKHPSRIYITDVRIDWQLYRSRPDKGDAKLLDLCALFGEAFRPAHSRIPPPAAAEGNEEDRPPPSSEVDEFRPIRLILRPHEGQLVGKSPWAMTSEVPETDGLAGL